MKGIVSCNVGGSMKILKLDGLSFQSKLAHSVFLGALAPPIDILRSVFLLGIFHKSC